MFCCYFTCLKARETYIVVLVDSLAIASAYVDTLSYLKRNPTVWYIRFPLNYDYLIKYYIVQQNFFKVFFSF